RPTTETGGGRPTGGHGAQPRKKWPCHLLGRGGAAVLALEALDPAGGVHQLLFAGVEGVALGADFHVDVALVGRAGRKAMPAGAYHLDGIVGGMNRRLHGQITWKPQL